MYDMKNLLTKMAELNASDLHISSGTPPAYRINGVIVRVGEETLTPSYAETLIKSIMSDDLKGRLEEDLEVDFAIGFDDISRFRVNVFREKGNIAAAFRLIPYKIRTMEELKIPAIAKKLCEKPRGLILVTGPTGSGKSTSLAAMIDYINSTRKSHIVTMEDPIEYMHNHKMSVVHQREIHADTVSFTRGLKSVLRQDPDIVLIGEMRDAETISSALTVSETGHLTFGTLHTNSAVQTINRIIEVFPPHEQPQIRTQLSFVLEGVISQQLLPTKDGNSRVMAMEIMVPTPAIRNLIREDKVHQIYSSMQTGQMASGMITMTQSLVELAKGGFLSAEGAISAATMPDEVSRLLSGVR